MRALSLPYPVLLDAERETYRHYGLGRAALVIQKSATFVIDRTGIVRHATASFNPGESMDFAAVLRALEGLADPRAR